MFAAAILPFGVAGAALGGMAASCPSALVEQNRTNVSQPGNKNRVLIELHLRGKRVFDVVAKATKSLRGSK
jgi:hypothetical protein